MHEFLQFININTYLETYLYKQNSSTNIYPKTLEFDEYIDYIYLLLAQNKNCLTRANIVIRGKNKFAFSFQ